MKPKKNSIHNLLKGERAGTSLGRNQRAVSRGAAGSASRDSRPCHRHSVLPLWHHQGPSLPTPPSLPPTPHRKAGFLSWAAGTWLLPNAFIFYVSGETIHTCHTWLCLGPRILEDVSACFRGSNQLCFEVASVDTDLFGGHAVTSRRRKSETISGTCVVIIVLTAM